VRACEFSELKRIPCVESKDLLFVAAMLDCSLILSSVPLFLHFSEGMICWEVQQWCRW